MMIMTPEKAKTPVRLCLTLLAVLIITAAAMPSAEAKRYKHHSKYGGYDRIKIVSRFSPNKYVIVPIRDGRYGDAEVRLPGGTWIDCERNCEWTVQKKYLDFWEYQQSPFGPGYLRRKFYLD